MKLNKGFTPIAIVLIIIGVLAVGSVAYYFGKSSNTLSKVAENNVANVPVQNTDADCLSTTAPYIKVLSPNGGETYYKNSSIDLKWKSCNVPSAIHLNAQLVDVYNNSSDGLALLCEGGSSTWGAECLNDGEQVFGTIKWKAGIYKIRIASSEGVSVVDISDNSFTILGENAPNNQPYESGNDLDGQHIGYIKGISFSNENYSMKIDYVQWISPCSSDIECPNGYEIINDNPLVRTLSISNGVIIKMQTYSHDSSGNFNSNEVISLLKLKNFVNDKNSTNSGTPFWITLKNGVITEITEQYIP